MVNLELTDQEALAFREWRKYQDQFEVLAVAGVFQTQVGKVVIDFRDRQIERINVETVVWKKKLA